jgi:hypothetical protein
VWARFAYADDTMGKILSLGGYHSSEDGQNNSKIVEIIWRTNYLGITGV